MNHDGTSPFDSIESAHEFVVLLAETAGDTKREIAADLQKEAAFGPSRRQDALRIVVFNLEKLEFYMGQSRRILNDLRTLRRLLFEERAAAPKQI